MKDFHVHSVTSKKSAFDYIAAIRRKSNALVSNVPVRRLDLIERLTNKTDSRYIRILTLNLCERLDYGGFDDRETKWLRIWT